MVVLLEFRSRLAAAQFNLQEIRNEIETNSEGHAYVQRDYRPIGHNGAGMKICSI